jgi:hypothetical protein
VSNLRTDCILVRERGGRCARSRMDRRHFAAQRQRRTRAICGAHFREKRAWLIRTPQGDHSAERSASILKRQRAAALELLLRAVSPKEISGDNSPEALILREAQQEVNRAFAEAKRAVPKFSGLISILRIHTPCQVHPLIAQIWRTRLPKYVVFCANSGYRDGFVHFSGRCGKETDLIAFLRDHAPADPGENYGRGHPQAASGSMPVRVWNAWTAALGFGNEVAA